MTKPTTKKSTRKTTVLTPKQLHFCRCQANGMTQADSYRESYNAKNMTNESIYQEACRLAKNPKIKSRVDYLIAQKEAALIRSSVGLKAKVLDKLEEFMEQATTSDGNKIRATELLGKSIGLFKDVVEDNREIQRTPEELTALLQAKLERLQSDKTTH